MNTSRLVALCLYAYIFFNSWTDAFKIGAWRPIYMVPLLGALLLAFFHSILSKNIQSLRISFSWPDIGILLLFLHLLLSSTFNTTPKTLNYLLAYVFVIFVQYFLLKQMLIKYTNFKTLLNVNSVAILVVSVFCCTDLFLESVFSFDLQVTIPRTRAATATVANGLFRRSYGFSTEPTIVAYYLNALAPIALWNIRERKFYLFSGLKPLCFLVVFVALLSTFSTAGFVVLFVTCLITVIFVWRPKRSSFTTKKIIKYLIIFMFVCFLVYLSSDFWLRVFEDNWGKLTLNKDYKSVRGRLGYFQFYFNEVLVDPFWGYGLGKVSSSGMSSPMNWYLMLAYELGVFPLVGVGIFLGGHLMRVLKMKTRLRIPFFMGILASCGHLGSVATFYNPFLWSLLAIFSFYLRETQKVGCGQKSGGNVCL